LSRNPKYPQPKPEDLTFLPKPAPPPPAPPLEAEVKLDLAHAPPPKAIQILSKGTQDLMREKQVLQVALDQEEAEMGRQSFWYFLTEILYPDTWEKNYTEEFHRPICETAQNLPAGEDLWAFLQREARKTFILDMAHNAWLIINDPNIRILMVGARLDTIKPFAKYMRDMFREGTPGFEKFHRLYPQFVLRKGVVQLKQAMQFTVPNRTVNLPDPTVRAAYRGVAGAGWRCDVLKLDDCVERRDVTTPEASAKTLGQILDLIPLVSKTSKYQNVIGVGTRWAYHDPYGRMLGETEDLEGAEEALVRFQERKVHIIMRHAVEDPETLCEACPAHVTVQWPHGNPVPPEGDEGVVTLDPIMTRDGLVKTLNHYRVDPNKGESLWWHQYQNVCMAPSAQKIKSEWYDLVLAAPTWPVPKRRVLAIDSADKDFQKKGVGDYMVALFGDFDDVSRLCLRHGMRSNKWTREQFLQRIVAWCQGVGWWPQVVVKEKFGEDNFLADVQRKFRDWFHPVHAHTITRPQYNGTTMKKYDWIIESLQAPMERGEVIFGSAFPNELRGRLQYEGTNLSQTSHDDGMDALSLFFAPGVRPKAANPAVTRPPSWAPPAMDLYEPGAQGPPVPTMNPGQAQGQRVRMIFDDAGFSQVTWDPVPGAQVIRFDE
jgi:hypothetical protein